MLVKILKPVQRGEAGDKVRETEVQAHLRRAVPAGGERGPEGSERRGRGTQERGLGDLHRAHHRPAY